MLDIAAEADAAGCRILFFSDTHFRYSLLRNRFSCSPLKEWSGAGVESKYTGKEDDTAKGDEQFEIDDDRSFETMYKDMSDEGLQPVLNDYVYV